MTKAELTERIVDALIDPWTDDPEEYLDLSPIDLAEAEEFLKEIRINESSADLEPDECLPAEVTPAQVQETWNCLLRARKHEARVARLAEWIEDNDPVCEYVNFYAPCHDVAADMFPVEFLDNDDSSALIDGRTLTPLELIELGKRSRDFNSAEEYCYYDKDKDQLVSTDNPFSDGILNAEDFAEFILDDAETFEYMFDGILDDDDTKRVLGCTLEEYRKGA